jgi:hypothetical protein
MPPPELTPEERDAVVAALRKLINEDPFPYAPRLKPLKGALAKLSPTTVVQRPLPAPKEPFKAEDRPRFSNAAKRSRRTRVLG